MRLQTNSQRRRPVREQSAEPIFVGFVVMLQLPVFQRSQREREASCFAEDTLVVTKQARAQQSIDQLLVRLIGGFGHRPTIVYYRGLRRPLIKKAKGRFGNRTLVR